MFSVKRDKRIKNKGKGKIFKKQQKFLKELKRNYKMKNIFVKL